MKYAVNIYRKSEFYPDKVLTKTALITLPADVKDTNAFTEKIIDAATTFCEQTRQGFVEKFPEFKNSDWIYKVSKVEEEISLS